MQTPVETLVLGTGITALGALRSLARKGLPARVASDWPFLYRLSRSCRLAPVIQASLPAYLNALPLEGAVLIPCSDRWAREVAGLGNETRDRFPSSLPPIPVLDRFLDKGLFSRALEEQDVPHPRTIIVDAALKVDHLDALDRFFVKPRNSQLFHKHFGVKAFLSESGSDLADKVMLAQESGLEVMLQEYVPGPASNHYFVDGFIDVRGEVRALFARRRLRMHPPNFGNSSYMVSIPRAEVAQAVNDLIRLLTAEGYRGIFSAEFKKDERDGVFKILEVNARPWWFVEFAAKCGMDVVEMAYRDALGEPVKEGSDYRVGNVSSTPTTTSPHAYGRGPAASGA